MTLVFIYASCSALALLASYGLHASATLFEEQTGKSATHLKRASIALLGVSVLQAIGALMTVLGET